MLREDVASRAQAAVFASLMIDNITKDNRKFIKNMIGEYNRRFANELGRDIVDALGENGKNLLNMSYNEFVRAIKDIYNLINDR